MGSRPLVVGVALVDGVDAYGMLALIPPIAAHNLRADLEPALGLPAQSGNGVVVGVGVHVGVGVFVFELLAHHHLGFVGIGSHEAREGHLGQQVACDVGIAVIGDAVAVVWRVIGGFGRDAHRHVGVVVSQEEHGNRWDIPCVVCVVEVRFHLVGVGTLHFAKALHFGQDALLDTVVSQLVGILAETLVVGDDNEVFASSGAVVHPFLHTSLVVDDGQLVVVGQVLHEDGIPIGRTQAVVAKLAIAAVEAYAKLQVVVHAQLFRDGVVLIWRHGDGHGLHATQAEGLGNGDRLFREESVPIVDAVVLFVGVGAVVGVKLDGCGGQQVDILDSSHAAVTHLDVGIGAVWDSHKAAKGGQVGLACVSGQDDTRAALQDFACIAVIGNVDDL